MRLARQSIQKIGCIGAAHQENLEHLSLICAECALSKASLFSNIKRATRDPTDIPRDVTRPLLLAKNATVPMESKLVSQIELDKFILKLDSTRGYLDRQDIKEKKGKDQRRILPAIYDYSVRFEHYWNGQEENQALSICTQRHVYRNLSTTPYMKERKPAYSSSNCCPECGSDKAFDFRKDDLSFELQDDGNTDLVRPV